MHWEQAYAHNDTGRHAAGRPGPGALIHGVLYPQRAVHQGGRSTPQVRAPCPGDSAQQMSGVAAWHRQQCLCWAQHYRNRSATALHNMHPRPYTCACTRHPTNHVRCLRPHKAAHCCWHRQSAHLLPRHLGQLVGQLSLPLSCRPVEHTPSARVGGLTEAGSWCPC